MIGLDILFFFFGSIVGFLVHTVLNLRNSTPPGTRTYVLLVILSFLALLAFLVLAVWSLDAIPGDSLYVVKKLAGSIYAVQLILGMIFGFIFRVWARLSHAVGTQAGHFIQTFYVRWGLFLLVLFLTGIFVGPANRMFPYISTIDTPLVSLNFGNLVAQEPESLVARDIGPNNNGAKRENLSKSFQQFPEEFIKRDKQYIRLIYGNKVIDNKFAIALARLEGKMRFIGDCMKRSGISQRLEKEHMLEQLNHQYMKKDILKNFPRYTRISSKS